jgi:prevent-host-death family protein
MEGVETLSTAEARSRFSEVVNRAAYGKERIVLARRGKELVAVIPIEDLELLEYVEEKVDLELARQALAEAHEEGTVPFESLLEELGIADGA